MKNSFLKKGFTLIELLVVIAIIGILAAVVLASLNDARDSGNDAAIKQTLGNLRSQAEIFYNQNNFSYAGVCATTNTETDRLMDAVVANGSQTSWGNDAASSATVASCNDDTTAWAASGRLSAGGYWCVDSTGYAASTTAGLTTTSDYICN